MKQVTFCCKNGKILRSDKTILGLIPVGKFLREWHEYMSLDKNLAEV